MKKFLVIIMMVMFCSAGYAADNVITDGVANLTWDITDTTNLWGYRVKIYLETGVLIKDTTNKHFDYDYGSTLYNVKIRVYSLSQEVDTETNEISLVEHGYVETVVDLIQDMSNPPTGLEVN